MPISNIRIVQSSATTEYLQSLSFTDDAVRIVLGTFDRAIARGMTGIIPSALILWSMLRWEKKLGVGAIEALLGDLHSLELAVDVLLVDIGTRPLNEFIDMSCVNTITDAAVIEAKSMGTSYVGTEHILLALLQDNDAGLRALFLRFGVNRDKVVLALTSLIRSE